MMTLTEARQRAEIHKARIEFDRDYKEYRVTLYEWPEFRGTTEDKAYYTDDLEDAVCTAGAMRRDAQKAIVSLANTNRFMALVNA